MRLSPRLSLAAIFLVWGCATKVPPVKPVTVASPPQVASPQGVAPPQAAASPQDVPLLSPPVMENQSFVTIAGVPQYKIGPGDILEILVTRGAAQETQVVTVRASGAVSVASIEAKVGGQTPEQAAAEIRRALSPLYRQLDVEVLVKEYNSKKVSVLGAVAGKPGTVPLRGRTTLLELLAEVGGPAPGADLERIRLVHSSGPALTIDLNQILESPGAQGLVLDAGDIVLIPQRATAVSVASAEQPKVFIIGEVRAPGAVPYLPNMRLYQALTLAGGPTDLAVLESARIIRGDLLNAQVLEADFRRVIEEGDRTQDLPLLPNDFIVLPRQRIGNWNVFLAKLRPTFEFITTPLQPVVQYLLLQDLIRRQ